MFTKVRRFHEDSMSFVFTFVCIFFALTAVAAPYTVSLMPRQDTSPTFSSIDDIAHAINTTITDRAGYDISSSFEIRVFYDPSAPRNNTNPTNTSSSDDSLMNRQVASYRHITYCPHPSATFTHSVCTHTANQPGSLQSYTITCHRIQNFYHPYTGEFLHSTTHPVRRDGRCWGDEVCIDNFGPGNELMNSIGRQFANCVRWRNFRVVKPPIGLKLDKQSVMRALEGKRLSMVVSKADKSTPMEVDTFDVKTNGADTVAVKGGSIDKCRDCVDLETQQFKKGVASLKAEARMLTTGAAVAGILWLALI